MEPLESQSHAQVLATALAQLQRQLKAHAVPLIELEQSLLATSAVVKRHDELTAELAVIADAIRRAEAESASRVNKCAQREAAAQQRYDDAEAGRHRDLATLESQITALKAEITTLTAERQRVREELQLARHDQADALVGLKSERDAAVKARDAVREALGKIKETIPT